jgi:hypothetical protein
VLSYGLSKRKRRTGGGGFAKFKRIQDIDTVYMHIAVFKRNEPMPMLEYFPRKFPCQNVAPVNEQSNGIKMAQLAPDLTNHICSYLH